MADGNVDDLIEEIIKQKPEITREEIMSRMAAKKEAVGANYLTDRGAIFLVASEYGVTVGKPIKTDMAIKDIYSGASEITLEARVLGISPVKQYTKKDGEQGALRMMSIYDSADGATSVKMWGDKSILPGLDEIKPGDAVKISNAFVKQDMDGSLAIHVGSNSAVERIEKPQHRDIPDIKSITKDASALSDSEEASNLAVSGIMEGDITLFEYTRRQSGEAATALKLRLRGDDGVVKRVVLWGKDMSSVPKKIVSTAPKVTLLGVSTRRGQQQQDMEMHGNESSQIIIEDGDGGDGAIEPITVRIISKPPATDNSRGDGTRQPILAVDASRRIYSIMDTAQMSVAYNEGEIVECMPAQIHGTRVTIDTTSFIRNADGDDSTMIMPTLEDVVTSISDADPNGGLYCIGCVVLNEAERREIQTKSGDSVYLAEIGIGDGSGESVLKAWRDQSRMLENYKMGTKCVVTGVRAQMGMGGVVDFTLTEYSTIKKIEEQEAASGNSGGVDDMSSRAETESPPQTYQE